MRCEKKKREKETSGRSSPPQAEKFQVGCSALEAGCSPTWKIRVSGLKQRCRVGGKVVQKTVWCNAPRMDDHGRPVELLGRVNRGSDITEDGIASVPVPAVHPQARTVEERVQMLENAIAELGVVRPLGAKH